MIEIFESYIDKIQQEHLEICRMLGESKEWSALENLHIRHQEELDTLYKFHSYIEESFNDKSNY